MWGFIVKIRTPYMNHFLETDFNNTIDDDRYDFFLDKENTLCLYVNAGGEPVNATFSGVTIF